MRLLYLSHLSGSERYETVGQRLHGDSVSVQRHAIQALQKMSSVEFSLEAIDYELGPDPLGFSLDNLIIDTSRHMIVGCGPRHLQNPSCQVQRARVMEFVYAGR